MPPSNKGGRKRPRATASGDVGAAAVASQSTLPHEGHEDYQVGPIRVVERHAGEVMASGSQW